MLANWKSLLFLTFKLPFYLSQSKKLSEEIPKSDHLNGIELIKKPNFRIPGNLENTIKFHIKGIISSSSWGVLGGLINGGGGLISSGVYKQNKINVSEQRDKRYPRTNYSKHTVTSRVTFIIYYFIVHHNKRRMHFKNMSKTLMWLERNRTKVKKLQALTLSIWKWTME